MMSNYQPLKFSDLILTIDIMRHFQIQMFGATRKFFQFKNKSMDEVLPPAFKPVYNYLNAFKQGRTSKTDNHHLGVERK